MRGKSVRLWDGAIPLTANTLREDRETHRRSLVEFCGMLERSPVMQEALRAYERIESLVVSGFRLRVRFFHRFFSLIQRLPPHARVVLICGETGAPKELTAR